MSNTQRCTLTDTELIDKTRNLISKLCDTGGRSFTMSVPVDHNNDTDMVLSELLRRFEYSRNTVLAEVASERNRQDAKWGAQNHTPMHWIPILVEEVGEASKAALEHHFKYPGADLDKYREELVQVAAVAVAMVECLDRNQEAQP